MANVKAKAKASKTTDFTLIPRKILFPSSSLTVGTSLVKQNELGAFWRRQIELNWGDFNESVRDRFIWGHFVRRDQRKCASFDFMFKRSEELDL